MAKGDAKDLLERWQRAEEKYRSLADGMFSGSVGKVDKAAIVDLTKARVKADRRMQDFFSRSLS